MATEEETQHQENNNIKNHDNNSKDAEHIDSNSQSNPIYDQLFNIGVTLTSNKLGQYVVRKIDRLLWIIENTAKWSVPQNISESESTVPPPPLIRPLNWFLFIPALIVMRLCRAGASFVLLMCGYDALAPATVVQLLQKQRRVLRAVRYQGLKTIRMKNHDNSHTVKKGLFSVLLSFVGGLICTRGNLEEPVKIVIKSNNRSNSDGNACKKRHLSDEDEGTRDDDRDKNLSCVDMLEKYGSISSCDDSDFEPENVSDEESSDDTDEESEPEGINQKDGKNDEEEEVVAEQNGEEHNKTNSSEPVEITQNNNKYYNAIEYKNEQHPATLYGSNPEDKFYSPIGSPIPPEEHNHNTTQNDTGDQSNKQVKFYHQTHHFPNQSRGHHRHNFNYQHNSHYQQQNHNSSFNNSGFLAHERSFSGLLNTKSQYHGPPSAHQMNGGDNNTQYQQHEPKLHLSPSSSSSTASATSTTKPTPNVTGQPGQSNNTAPNSNPNRRKTQTRYNKYNKNKYYGGGNKQQNGKKNI